MNNTNNTVGRTLVVPGTINLRDLGGYRGCDGKEIRTGQLFRSDQLSQLTDQGVATLREIGINTIVDLRSDPEVAKAPNRDIGARRTLHCNPSAETAELSASFQADAEDEDRMLVEGLIGNLPEDPAAGILLQYRRFAGAEESIAAFQQFMLAVCEPQNAPLLFHCRGGKDRTGFGSLLVLGALGVSDRDIVADYMQTQQNRRERTAQKMQKYRIYTQDEAVLSYLLALLDCAPEYIETSLREVRRLGGGTIDGYLTGVLGLTDRQLATMRDAYLKG